MSLATRKIFINWKDCLTSFLFIFPAIFIFGVFYIYPFFETFNLALREWNGISLARPLIGFLNFRDLAVDKVWWEAVWHAFYITLFALTFQNALAFSLALACDREIKAKHFYCMVFFFLRFYLRWLLVLYGNGF